MKIIVAYVKVGDSGEALLKDSNCSKSKEHFRFGLRTLELVSGEEIKKLLDTIISVSNLLR